MKYSKLYTIALAALTVAACHVEPFENLTPAIQGPKEGQLSFKADLACGPATKSDYETFKVERPSTGETVEIEAFLRPMGGGTMSGISDTPEGEEFAAPETKAAPVTSMYTSFDFAAFPYDKKTANRTTSGYYTVDGMRYSDFEDAVRFFCWAPGNAQGVTYDAAAKKLTYQTPADVTGQPDLVVAYSQSILPDHEEPVDLTFKHALAGIQVKTASIFPDCTVNSVTLKNVYGKGEYDPATDSWTVDTESLMDIELLPAAKTGVTVDYTLAADDYTAMIIPQVLPAGCDLTISLTWMSREWLFTFPMETKSMPGGTILLMGLNCRSMQIFEGTADGPFEVIVGPIASKNRITVTPDEDGFFSVALPFLSEGNRYWFYTGDAATNASGLNMVKTITRVPDYMTTSNSMTNMFANMPNLTSVCDLTNTGSVSDFSHLFNGCKSLSGCPMMDTSSGTNFSYMFSGCSTINNIPVLNTSKGTSFESTFMNCSSLQTLPGWDFSTGRNFLTMCASCASLKKVEAFNCPSGTNFERTFINCKKLETLPESVDVHNARTMRWMFRNCSSLKRCPDLIAPLCTNFSYMFDGCSKLEESPVMDTSSGTNFLCMYQGTTAMSTWHEHSLEKGTDIASIFADSGVTYVNRIYAPVATSAGNVFYGAKKLVTVDEIYIPKAKNLSNFFHSCYELTSVPMIDFTNVTSVSGSMFYSCRSLTDVAGLPGLSKSMSFYMATGSGAYMTVPLTHESLMNVINGLAIVDDPQTLKLGPSLLAKLSAEEIAIATGKGWIIE